MNSKMKILNILIVLTLCTLKYIIAQDSTKILEFTLEQTQKYAIENNYSIQNAKLDIDIAKKKVWETAAIGLPQINGSVLYQNIFNVPTMIFGGFTPVYDNGGTLIDLAFFEQEIELGVKENTTYSITASQLIFSGEYFVGLKASKTYKKLSLQSLEKSEKNIKELVSQIYLFTQMLEENKKILKSSLTNLTKTLYETEIMYKTGFLEETDVAQIQLVTKNIENSLSSVERQLTNSYNLLKFQMGIDLEQEIKLTESLENIFKKVNTSNVTEQKFNLENHIDYKLITTQEHLTLLSLKRDKVRLLPSLSAFYTHEELKNEPEFNFIPPDIIGVSLNIPIWGSGSKLYKIQQAKLELKKIKNTKLQLAQSLQLGVKQARTEFQNAQEKYYNEKDNMNLSKKIYDKTLIKFKEGLSTSMELTQTQNQYLTAQSNYFTAIFELLNAKNKLDKALNNF